MRHRRRPSKATMHVHEQHYLKGALSMSKEQRSNKEEKKKPAKTVKEKRAAKKQKKENKGSILDD